MKINEVEALVGITKKNIRFYEDAGLISPRRNTENGYRDYGDTEVETLKRIKLFRKLGFSLEDIRQMQSGVHTVGDGMRRHLVTLERERENLAASVKLCSELTSCHEKLDALNAQPLLERMVEMEQEGTTFMDKQRQDMKRQYAAPIVAAMVMAFLMAAVIWLLLWAFRTDPVGAPPLPLLIVLIALPAAVILGVLIALKQRLRELQQNEAHDAKKY